MFDFIKIKKNFFKKGHGLGFGAVNVTVTV